MTTGRINRVSVDIGKCVNFTESIFSDAPDRVNVLGNKNTLTRQSFLDDSETTLPHDQPIKGITCMDGGVLTKKALLGNSNRKPDN